MDDSTEDGWEYITGEDAEPSGDTETARDESTEISAEDAGVDTGQNIAGDDPAGSSDDSGAPSGDVGAGSEQAGDTEAVETQPEEEQEETLAEEQQGETVGDYVTSQQADEAIAILQAIDAKLDVCASAGIVLVITLMACLGALAVQTMVRSFEARK